MAQRCLPLTAEGPVQTGALGTFGRPLARSLAKGQVAGTSGVEASGLTRLWFGNLLADPSLGGLDDHLCHCLHTWAGVVHPVRVRGRVVDHG
jgi:hypothetical protein